MARLIWIAVTDFCLFNNRLPDLPNLIIASPAIAGACIDKNSLAAKLGDCLLRKEGRAHGWQHLYNASAGGGFRVFRLALRRASVRLRNPDLFAYEVDVTIPVQRDQLAGAKSSPQESCLRYFPARLMCLLKPEILWLDERGMVIYGIERLGGIDGPAVAYWQTWQIAFGRVDPGPPF